MIQDDRTPEQKTTHTNLAGGRDSFMSGWGEAEGGASYAYWACTDASVDAVTRWVESRGDITVSLYNPASKAKHTHVYVVGPNHPALEG
jgi:hypothetical protein